MFKHNLNTNETQIDSTVIGIWLFWVMEKEVNFKSLYGINHFVGKSLKTMLIYFPSLVSTLYIQLPYLGHHCEL